MDIGRAKSDSTNKTGRRKKKGATLEGRGIKGERESGSGASHSSRWCLSRFRTHSLGLSLTYQFSWGKKIFFLFLILVFFSIRIWFAFLSFRNLFSPHTYFASVNLSFENENLSTCLYRIIYNAFSSLLPDFVNVEHFFYEMQYFSLTS